MKGNLWASLTSQIWGTTAKSEFVVGGFEQVFYFLKCENGIISCQKLYILGSQIHVLGVNPHVCNSLY